MKQTDFLGSLYRIIKTNGGKFASDKQGHFFYNKTNGESHSDKVPYNLLADKYFNGDIEKAGDKIRGLYDHNENIILLTRKNVVGVYDSLNNRFLWLADTIQETQLIQLEKELKEACAKFWERVYERYKVIWINVAKEVGFPVQKDEWLGEAYDLYMESAFETMRRKLFKELKSHNRDDYDSFFKENKVNEFTLKEIKHNMVNTRLAPAEIRINQILELIVPVFNSRIDFQFIDKRGFHRDLRFFTITDHLYPKYNNIEMLQKVISFMKSRDLSESNLILKQIIKEEISKLKKGS